MGSTVIYNEQSRAFTRPLSDNPEITIVIPCYAQAHYLSEALDSVMRSEAERTLEIIVVDDGSPDDVLSVCRRYSGVGYLRLYKNLGVSCARNEGVGNAAGEKIVTLDADDALMPDTLEIWAQTLDEHPEAYLVYGDHELVGLMGGIVRQPQASWEHFSRGPCIPSACMQRREVWERIKEHNGTGYDPSQPYGWEDALYYLEMYALGMEAIHIDHVGFRYRIGIHNRNQIAAQNQPKIKAYQRERIKRLYRLDVY